MLTDLFSHTKFVGSTLYCNWSIFLNNFLPGKKDEKIFKNHVKIVKKNFYKFVESEFCTCSFENPTLNFDLGHHDNFTYFFARLKKNFARNFYVPRENVMSLISKCTLRHIKTNDHINLCKIESGHNLRLLQNFRRSCSVYFQVRALRILVIGKENFISSNLKLTNIFLP